MEWGSGLEQTVENYFKDLFRASNTNWERVPNQVQSKVTMEQNTMLLTEVTERGKRSLV